jgi:hypothetical protein
LAFSLYITSDDISSSHARVIFEETQEWDKAPILDIQTTSGNTKCALGYETLTGKFFGT